VSWNEFGIAPEDSSFAEVSDCTVTQNEKAGIILMGSAQAMISSCTVSANREVGVAVAESARAVVTGCSVFDNREGIALAGSAEASIRSSKIYSNDGRGVVLLAAPCGSIQLPFNGRVDGTDNAIPGPSDPAGNRTAAVCPDTLSFLSTPEGGELDSRPTP